MKKFDSIAWAETVVPRQAINAAILRALSARAQGMITPMTFDLSTRAPDVASLTDVRGVIDAIDGFFMFLCELNSLEFVMVDKVRESLNKARQR